MRGEFRQIKKFLDNANPLYFIPIPTMLCYFCLILDGG